MSKSRLEAFSDGVIAIIITIMVLELRPPHDVDVRALREMGPDLCAYVLSFVLLGIYWNNHHVGLLNGDCRFLIEDRPAINHQKSAIVYLS